MADEQKNVKLNIDPNVTSDQKVKNLINELQQLDKLTDRIYKKGKNNNFTISAKDNANVRGTAGNVRSYANSVSSSLSSSMDKYDDMKTGAISGSSAEMKKLEQLSYKMMSALYSAQSHGYNPSSGTINPGAQFDKIMSYRVNTHNKNFSNPTGNDAKTFDELNTNMKTSLRDLGSKINNVRYNSNKINNNVGNTIRYGTVSSERLNQYRSSLSMGPERVSDLQSQVEKYRSIYTGHSDKIGNEISSISSKEKAGKFSPQEAQSENARKISLQREQEALHASIKRLNEFSNTLDSANSSFKKANVNLESSITGGGTGTGGTLDVQAPRDSFAGMMKNRLPSIMMGATSTAMATTSGLYSSGSSNRLQAEQYIDPIMLSQANQRGTSSKGADNRVLNNLSTLGIKNGTGYDSQQMSQFGSAYTTSTGNSSNYYNAANAYSKLARFSGMGSTTALGLETSAGNAGVTSSKFAKSVAGEINNSNMVGRSSDQASALSSVLSSESKYGVSNGAAERTSALQGQLSRYGSTLQGSNFTSAYTSTSDALTNYNDSTSRFMFGANSPKYSGVGGQASLLEDMQDAKTDPSKLKTPIANLLKSNGGNVKQAAATLSLQTGQQVTVRQATAMINAYKKGDFNKKKLDEIVNKNNKTGYGTGSSQYGDSGESTINQQNALMQRSSENLSQSTDSFRGAGNVIGGMVPGVLLGAGTVIGATGLKLGGKVLGSLGVSAVRGLGKTSLGKSVASSIGGTKGGKWLSGLFRGGSKESPTAEGKTIVDKYGRPLSAEGKSSKSLFERVKGFGKSDKVSSFKEKATSIGKSTLEKGKGLFKSSSESGGKSFLSKGLSGASKLGKVGKGTAGINAIFAGIDIANTLGTTKKGSSKRHKGIGEAIGSGIGGVVGTGLGALIPGLGETGVGEVGGGVLGSSLGSKVGSWVGGLFGGSSSSKKKSSKSLESGSETTKYGNKRSKVNKDQASLLKGFNDMLDKAEKVIAEAKGINGSKSDSKSSSSSDVKGTSGKGSEALKSISKKVGDDLKVDPSYVYAQLALESADGTSPLSSHNNYGGVKYTSGMKGATKGSAPSDGTGGNYAYFNSTDAFASVYENTLKNAGVSNSSSLTDFNNKLKKAGYYTSSSSDYLAMLQSKAKNYHAHGGIFNTKLHAVGGIFDTATKVDDNNIVAESGREAAIPMGAGHRLDGESMVNQVARGMGKIVISQGELSRMKNNKVSSPTISPSYNININADKGSDTGSISSAVSQALKSSNDKLTQQLRSFFANSN